MASGNTLLQFGPLHNEISATAWATLDVRNQHVCLAFDDVGVREQALFSAALPRHYASGGLTVYLHWSAVATTGTVGWLVAFERIGSSQQDIDADGFAADQTVTAATVPGTSGFVSITNVAVSNGANIDSIAVGELFRLRVKRDWATDTAVGDAQLLVVEVKET